MIDYGSIYVSNLCENLHIISLYSILSVCWPDTAIIGMFNVHLTYMAQLLCMHHCVHYNY